jgi:dimethylglycine dehydrogenase
LAFAYVDPKLAETGLTFDVMIHGEMHKSRIIPESIWDPENERLKA